MTSSTQPSEQFLEVEHHKIAYIRGGTDDGRLPVVFVHGIEMSVHFWPIVLAGHPLSLRNWASLSLPAHFPSTTPSTFQPDDVTPELFAAVSRAVSRELFDGQTMHLVGWSTGGFASLATAALDPEIVASVTTISGFARGNWGNLLGIMQRIARLPFGRAVFRLGMNLIALRKGSFATVCWFLSAKRIEQTPRNNTVLDVAFKDYCQHDSRGMASLFAGLFTTSIAELLPGIRVPVRVIGGTRDTAIPITETEFLASKIPNADLVKLPDVGHMFYAEAYDEVMESTLEWICRHDDVNQPAPGQPES